MVQKQAHIKRLHRVIIPTTATAKKPEATKQQETQRLNMTATGKRREVLKPTPTEPLHITTDTDKKPAVTKRIPQAEPPNTTAMAKKSARLKIKSSGFLFVYP